VCVWCSIVLCQSACTECWYVLCLFAWWQCWASACPSVCMCVCVAGCLSVYDGAWCIHALPAAAPVDGPLLSLIRSKNEQYFKFSCKLYALYSAFKQVSISYFN
jgi:hypothetical protein